ncbi:MAG TPA: hypothetical protein VHD60_01395 [Candidatus Saccharimonadales bacterium]|nr:hypothetical protein [Candidatus Saccharimonadales bacterium]
MDEQRSQLVEKLKGANNILVTVSNNPSVDQLAACIGLTILLNKLDKHATAVFSGNVPSTIEFLKPEETLEQNTDSLRDFIIALDKAKADKLRYKVEDKVVKIFITPYRTSISQDDLEFSQGDFNVDVVVALGVHEQRDLDQAITSHGRILHDAVVTTVNITPDGGLGTINWHKPSASSLSEMIEELGGELGKDLLDSQIATALLTGIVAETNRFSNEKTSAETMKVSGELMAAGANQQLVATELQSQLKQDAEPQNKPDDNQSPEGAKPPASTPPKSDDGTLEIAHNQSPPADQPAPPTDSPAEPEDDIDALLRKINEPASQEPPADAANDTASSSRPLTMQPPSLGGTLTANTTPEGLDPAIDPLSLPEVEQPLLTHEHDDNASAQASPRAPSTEPVQPLTPSPKPDSTLPQDKAAEAPPDEAKEAKGDDNEQTLIDIEQSVHSPHADTETTHLDSARDAVAQALNSAPDTDVPQHPIEALNALPLGEEIQHQDGDLPAPAAPPQEVHIDDEGNFHPAAPEPLNQPPAAEVHEPAPGEDISPANKPLDMPTPPTSFTPPPMPSPSTNPNGPPPNPPPFMPFSGPNGPTQQ